MNGELPIPVLGFAAFSGTGKTTLLRQLLPMLRSAGLKVGMIKHAHHGFDTDIPGKDSYELRRAGATQMLVASRERWALVSENEDDPEPSLAALLRRLDLDRLDLVLIEGYKAESFPKIELHRPTLGHPLLCLTDQTIIALASDSPLERKPDLPLLDLNRPAEILDFMLKHCGLAGAARRVATASSR